MVRVRRIERLASRIRIECSTWLSYTLMDARVGVEPTRAVSKAAVLPLDNPALATPDGLEPTTSGVTSRCYHLLSYGALVREVGVEPTCGLGFEASASSNCATPAGTEGWTRTSNLAVNSRLRYHCATSVWRKWHGFEPALPFGLATFKVG